MFRITSRTRGTDPFEIQEAEASNNADVPDGSSSWKPSLRRIKKGLFSPKTVRKSTESLQQQAGPHGYSITNTKSPQNTYRDQYISVQTGFERFSYSAKPKNPEPLPREKPKGPRDPINPKGFKFIKRSFSRRVKDATPAKDDNPDSRTQLTGADANPLRSVRRPIAVYVPTHGASDTSGVSSQNKLKKRDRAPSRPRSAAYVPLHAASDFSRMNLPPLDDRSNAIHSRNRSLSLSRQSVDGSNDYEAFLEASRREQRGPNLGPAPQMFYSTPQTSRALDDITATHHKRANSIAQNSNMSRRSKTPSFLEKIGDYIKPPRPESVHTYSGRKSFRDDRSINTREGKRNSTWGSIRRSFSRDRDGDKDGDRDEMSRRLSVMKRNNRMMPVSPGLSKYNEAVRGNQY